MKKINKLKAHQKADNQKKFGKNILKLVPEVKPYVRHRVYLTESMGLVRKNMYRSSEIINDAIIKIYESDISKLSSYEDLRIKMFFFVKEALDSVLKEEVWSHDTISTDKILHQELNKLKERFTMDADGDFVMNEELSDISYKQKEFRKQLFIFEDSAQSVKVAFDLDYLNEERKEVFTKLYRFLSLEASNIVDLHIFGKLTTSEIALITKTSEENVRAIIHQVKDSVYKILTYRKE